MIILLSRKACFTCTDSYTRAPGKKDNRLSAKSKSVGRGPPNPSASAFLLRGGNRQLGRSHSSTNMAESSRFRVRPRYFLRAETVPLPRRGLGADAGWEADHHGRWHAGDSLLGSRDA